jgi:hypothetical protein
MLSIPTSLSKIFSRNKTMAEEFLAAKDYYSWTPDATKLEEKSWQPLFVCCNLQKGGDEHHIVDGNYQEKDELGGSCNPYVYTEDRWELWKHKTGSRVYPIPLRTKAKGADLQTNEKQSPYSVRAARIKGRIFKIRSDVLFVLDRERHNGVVFNREKVGILHPYRYLGASIYGMARLSHEFVHPGTAWMYVGTDYWTNLMESIPHISQHFEPARLKQPRNPEYRRWKAEPYYLYTPWEERHNK